MAEVRSMREGELRWVQASGSGSTWATASAPASGIFGFVRSFSYTSAATFVVISERGVPDHNKIQDRQPIGVAVTCAYTGFHISAGSGSGASVPMVHLEFRASAAETPTTGRYVQIHGVPVQSIVMTEGSPEDTVAYTMQGLAMNGPTGSGYLS